LKEIILKRSVYSSQNEQVNFLMESPNKATDATNHFLETIRLARKKIRIVQSYITNIDEVDKALSDALKRNVEVEIITARKRD
jgi:phosphatidylserine/phosphatidylglycerophosphate/cardiolipin synthase-like enzyme